MTTDKDDNVAQQAILLVEKMLEYELCTVDILFVVNIVGA